MKYLVIIIMVVSTVNLFGQVQNFADIPKEILEHLDKMGVDDSLLLNCYESAYFNIIFEKSRKDFDFTEKKIAFRHAGKKSKKDFFKDEKERFFQNSTPVGGLGLYIFNATQQEESGGYDAAIVYWSKLFVPIEKVVERLKERR